MIMFRSFFRALILSALFIINTQAQTSERDIVAQSTEWFALNSNIKLHKRFGLAFDGQLRFVQSFQSAQHYVRLGGEAYIAPKLSIVPLGYMYVWNFIYGEQPTLYQNNEQRIWQQIIYRHSFKRLNFQHRFRMEERFLQVHHTTSDGTVVYDGYDIYLNRVRYRLQVQIPLNKPNMEAGAWFIGVFDEIFYGWGKGDTFNKPDQNRVYAAFGRQVNAKFRIEGGAFYQMLVKKNGAQQENNIGALVQFTYNLDFTNKES